MMKVREAEAEAAMEIINVVENKEGVVAFGGCFVIWLRNTRLMYVENGKREKRIKLMEGHFRVRWRYGSLV